MRAHPGRQTPDRLTVTYRLPGRLLSLAAGFWCLVGGLAIGIALALALVLTGVLDVDTDGWGGSGSRWDGTAAGRSCCTGYAWAVLRRRLAWCSMPPGARSRCIWWPERGARAATRSVTSSFSGWPNMPPGRVAAASWS